MPYPNALSGLRELADLIENNGRGQIVQSRVRYEYRSGQADS